MVAAVVAVLPHPLILTLFLDNLVPKAETTALEIAEKRDELCRDPMKLVGFILRSAILEHPSMPAIPGNIKGVIIE